MASFWVLCTVAASAICYCSATPVISGAGSSSASFASSYGSASQYGPGAGSGSFPAPIPPIPVQSFDYGQFQSKYFETLAKHFQQLNEQFAAQHAAIQQSLQQAIQQAQSAQGQAGGSYGPTGGYQVAAGGSQPQGGVPPYRFGGTGGAGGANSGQPVSALATAVLGPQGGYQTAQLTPANPNSPNVEQRFGAEGGTQPGGTYSVFTSSVSGSSDINGKKDSFRKAQTTINDNGKVTTYTVQDP